MSEKKQYEDAIDTFQVAQKKYKELEETLLSGSFLPPEQQADLKALVSRLRDALEDMNAKNIEARNSIRQAVVLAPTQWRGPDGSATSASYGPFTCSSVTKRTFNGDDLVEGVDKYALKDRLLELTSRDKNGTEYHLVQKVWEVDYEGVRNWLKAHALNDVLEGAYDEKESTPAVKGPKLMAFLGEELK